MCSLQQREESDRERRLREGKKVAEEIQKQIMAKQEQSMVYKERGNRVKDLEKKGAKKIKQEEEERKLQANALKGTQPVSLEKKLFFSLFVWIDMQKEIFNYFCLELLKEWIENSCHLPEAPFHLELTAVSTAFYLSYFSKEGAGIPRTLAGSNKKKGRSQD